MKFEHLFQNQKKGPEIRRTAERAVASSDDVLESQGKGFAFPVPKEIRDLNPAETIDAGEGIEPISKEKLFQVTLESMRQAWELEIKPRLPGIRNTPPDSMKKGSDFFTEADTSSESRIKGLFMESFGENNIRVFGEEADKYLGNLASRIGVRIDPVDGTESMKFAKPDWGIMVGVYSGVPENEEQVLGAVLFPERNVLMYQVKGVGVFIEDLELSETRKIEHVLPQDSLGNLIIQIWEHTKVAERGRTLAIRKKLDAQSARIRSSASSCGDVLEALTTQGNRAFIIDGDFNQVDFIPYAFLETVGYKLYKWDGTLVHADDTNLPNQKLVVVPPGQAGKDIRQIIKDIYSRKERPKKRK